jgi:hypothetical protein
MSEFERVAKQEEWCCTGRMVGKDEEMAFGCRTSLQAEYIRDAHNWTVSELTIAHEKDMTAKAKRIAELEAQLPKVVKPIYIKGLNIFNSDNVQIVVDEHYECPECGAILNLAVDSKDAKIATLEALVADYKEDLIDALQDVINYAPACTSSIEYAEKRLKELTETEK